MSIWQIGMVETIDTAKGNEAKKRNKVVGTLQSRHAGERDGVIQPYTGPSRGWRRGGPTIWKLGGYTPADHHTIPV
jgi:hypothetical protein